MKLVRRILRAALCCALLNTLFIDWSPRPTHASRSPLPVPSTTTQVTAAMAPMSAWGGHQNRIVRTATGVYTTWLTGTNDSALNWQLAHRESDGTWRVVATGIAGREPAHLLAGPTGRLYLVAAPGSVPTVWEGTPNAAGNVTLSAATVPGMEWAPTLYLAAGISSRGDLCVMVTPSGNWSIACRAAGTSSWNVQVRDLGLRYAYAYPMPQADGSVIIVGTRDVEWSELGWEQPPGAFAYDFTAFRVYRTNLAGTVFTLLHHSEELQTPGQLDVLRNAQADAFVDNVGRIHIVSWRRYPGSDGTENWHTMLRADGTVLAEQRIFASDGFQYIKLIQSADGRMWVLLNHGSMNQFDPWTGTSSHRIWIDLEGIGVDYAGFSPAVPRGGMSRCQPLIDVVYPASNGTWRFTTLSFTAPGLSRRLRTPPCLTRR